MRISKTLMTGAVAAVAVAGSANAAFVTFADLSLAGFVSKGGTVSGAPFDGFGTATSSGQSQVVGTGSTWTATRYLEATNAGSSMSVASNIATFTGGAGSMFTGNLPGSAAMRWDFTNAADLTGFTLRLNVSSVGTGGGSLSVRLINSDPTKTNSLGLTLAAGNTGAKDFMFLGDQSGVTGLSISWTPGTGSGNSLSLNSIQYNGVPAPGAIALLGAAGLVGSRRRR